MILCWTVTQRNLLNVFLSSFSPPLIFSSFSFLSLCDSLSLSVYVCAHVCTCVCRCPWRPEGASATGSCEQPDVGARNQIQVLRKSSSLRATSPALYTFHFKVERTEVDPVRCRFQSWFQYYLARALWKRLASWQLLDMSSSERVRNSSACGSEDQ